MKQRIIVALSAIFVWGAFIVAPAVAQTPATVKICVPTSTTVCPPVGPAAPFPVSSSPYQFTAAGAMQSALSVTTGAAVSLTPAAGSLAARICARGAINFTDDGSTNPTTGTGGVGTQMAGGNSSCFWEQGAALLTNFKAIAQTSNTSIDVSYFK